MIKELSKPVTLKDRNPFYNIIECLCNMLFVATANTQKILFKASMKTGEDTDAPHLIPWIQNVWSEMLRSNLFIRYKIHEDSVWMDEFMRLWLTVKLIHFLVEVNN
jgi:hypothetical protein